MRAVHTLCAKVESFGDLEVRFSSNVPEFKMAALAAGKANVVGEHLKKELNTLSPNDVHWIGVFDAKDKCIATCAAKFENFKGWSLQHQIVSYFERVFVGANKEPATLEKDSLNFAGVVSGSSVYIGEGHVNPEYRANNILGLIQRALIISAYWRWRPDIVYGFMRPDKIRKKYHLNWGYTVARPALLIWKNPPADESLHNLYFVAVGPEGVSRLSQNPLLAEWEPPYANNTQKTEPRDPSK